MRSLPSVAVATLVFAYLTVALLTCTPTAGAPQLFDAKLITPLTSASFRTAIASPTKVHLVNFYLARNGKCKEFASQYTALARGIKPEYLTVASVDCKESADICSEQGIDTDSLPVVKLVYPNHVNLLTAASEKKTPRDKTKARVLLFTDKRETGPLYKSLSLAFRPAAAKVVFAEVRKTEKKLFEHYGISTKNLPVLMIEPAWVNGEEKGSRRYEGKMEQKLLQAWVESFIGGVAATGAGGDGSSDSASSALAPIPELVDQSCVEKYCGGSLCILMLLSKEHPDLQRHLQQLSLISAAAKSNKRAGKFNFVWADAVVREGAAKWMQENFDVQAQDYPQLLLLSVRKARFAPYVGAFSIDGVVEFLEGVTKGSVRTVPLVSPGGELTKLPEGEACPKEKVEEKAPQQPSSSQQSPPKDEGELVLLDPKNHSEEVLKSVRPWVILFHAGTQNMPANLTADFDRVAKNMKDMVMFGQVDVEKYPELATHWGLDTNTLPAIYSLPHTTSSKDISSLKRFDADLTTSTPKDVRAFAQKLLEPAKVLTVTGQAMQTFMGDIQPNTPFGPKFLMFLKPAADGSVVIPDMVKALALEFGTPGGITFGVASSRERDLARQFNVTRVPAVFTMGQQEDIPGMAEEMKNQVRVAANAFGGNLVYGELQMFCEQTLRNYNHQKLQWLARAQAQPQRASSSRPSSAGKQSGSTKPTGTGAPGKAQKRPPPPPEEDDGPVDLDAQHDEL